jgi:hypothetical protein
LNREDKEEQGKEKVMKKKRGFFGFAVLAAAALAVFAGCGDAGGGPAGGGGDPDLSGTIAITPAGPVTVNTQLTATYSGGSESVSCQWKKGGSDISNETGTTYTPTEVGSYTVTVSASGYNSKTSAAVTVALGVRTDASIKTTFGINTTNTQGVTDTFNAVSAYLRSKTNAADVISEDLIRLGDYIDLPSITVTGGTPNPTVTDQAITPGTDPFTGYEGRLLRLIVVGINSFNENQGGSYNVSTGNGTEAHLVFQFQNVAFTHGMNTTNINAGGYAASEMRKYLVPLVGETGSGAFLAGLITAGVPDAVLWAPTRCVANGGSGATGYDELSDKLWLPTEREMFETQSQSHVSYETEANQARLAYYTDNAHRRKYNSVNTAVSYWEASPYSENAAFFCMVAYTGPASYLGAPAVVGCAPAFCVR